MFNRKDLFKEIQMKEAGMKSANMQLVASGAQ